MNLKLLPQKQDYELLVIKYREIERIALEKLDEEFARSSLQIMQIPHRIKTWESIEEKWSRKPDKYLRIENLTDLLGFQIICFFASQVDEAGEIVGRVFDVDREQSCDKRSMISPTSFGYLSLHIICSLKNDGTVPEELAGLKFEIQLRTILQHAWAELEHDLGYKNPFEIPGDLRREFSRIAGLLEIADEAFDNIKKKLTAYEHEVVERLRSDTADEMTLDIHTINAFVKYSPVVEKLCSDMAEITGGSILAVGVEPYLETLHVLHIETLGDLYALVSEERGHALLLLQRALRYSDLEEITTGSAFYYLIRARLIWGDYSEKELRAIVAQMSPDREKADRYTERILSDREELGL